MAPRAGTSPCYSARARRDGTGPHTRGYPTKYVPTSNPSLPPSPLLTLTRSRVHGSACTSPPPRVHLPEHQARLPHPALLVRRALAPARPRAAIHEVWERAISRQRAGRWGKEVDMVRHA